MAIVEQRNVSYSVILHIGIILFAILGLPVLLPPTPDPTPMVMSVEVLPISAESNVKPSDEHIQKEQHAPTPKPAKPTTPQPPTVTQKPKEPTPTPPDKTAPKPEEKHFDPMEGAEPVKDKPKPVEPPKDKPKDAPKPAADDFAALMNKLNKEAPKTPPVTDAKDKTNTAENKTKSDKPYDASLPLSISEKDAIRSQFIPCWRAPIGAKDAGSLAVRVKVELAEDATVKTAVIASDQQGRYNSDTYFRAAADAAVRAVHKCSPLKNLPADKYSSWSTMEINFDPRDL